MIQHITDEKQSFRLAWVVKPTKKSIRKPTTWNFKKESYRMGQCATLKRFFVDGNYNRAVFNWLSKVVTWLRLLRLVIGLKDSRQFFNQWEAKPKQTAPCTRDFSRATSELQVIARNCDWFITLFAPVVIGRSNCFGFGFSTVIWKPLYSSQSLL